MHNETMRKSYKQLNKEADQQGYGTYENLLLQETFAGRFDIVDFILEHSSRDAVKRVVLDMVITLAERHQFYDIQKKEAALRLVKQIIKERL